jgi:NitT/TauT family transport system permease protein
MSTQTEPIAPPSAARQNRGGPHRTGTAGRVVAVLLPPVLFGVLFVAAWQLFVRGAHIKSYVLPAPSDIWSAFTRQHDRIIDAMLYTGLNALVGLIIGTIFGVLLAGLATRLQLFGDTITPLVAALAAMPIVALAPLLNNMYSPLSTLPRREVVAITAFVPIFFNVLRGLSRLSPVHRELMQSYAASKTAVLRTIRVPGAMPFFFTGLRLASSLAVIAAVVSEYFGGVQDGLGPRITSSVGATDYPEAWASVLGAVLLGLLFYVAAVILERLVLGRRAAPIT